MLNIDERQQVINKGTGVGNSIQKISGQEQRHPFLPRQLSHVALKHESRSHLKVQMPNKNKSPMQETVTYQDTGGKLPPSTCSQPFIPLAGTLKMLQWPGGKELSGCPAGVLPTFILSLFEFPLL